MTDPEKAAALDRVRRRDEAYQRIQAAQSALTVLWNGEYLEAEEFLPRKHWETFDRALRKTQQVLDEENQKDMELLVGGPE
jgi:hypothetical protein